MTFVPSLRRICIVDESDGLRPIVTIEVSAHRVTVPPQASIDSFLIWLASISVMPTYGNDEVRIYQDDALHIYMHGLKAPYGHISSGAITFIRDELCLDDLVIRINKGIVTLPDGGDSFALAHFRYAQAVTPSSSSRLQGEKDRFLAIRSNSMIIMLALLANTQLAADDRHTLVDISKEMLNRLTAIYARFARVLDLGYPSGAAGSAKAGDDFNDVWRTVMNTWLIVPDRPYAPRSYSFSDELTQHYESMATKDLLDAVNAALACVGALDPGTLKKAATATKKEAVGRSFHEQLMSSQVIKRIDDAIEAAAPIELLRPMAQKRQAKIRSIG